MVTDSSILLGTPLVSVHRGDLEYLLAHVADEMHGHPDPAHWRLPLLTETLERLQQAANSDS